MNSYKNLKRIFSILNQWKANYILAAALLVGSMFLRMIEPKILQVTVDGVVKFFIDKKLDPEIYEDPVANAIYNILPTLSLDNLTWVLICIGLIYLVVALLRSVSQVSSAALTASSTEKAVKRLRDYLFKHIQHLPINFMNKTNTGELIQRCTGDVETVRKFILNQVVEVIRLAAIFIFAFAMMFVVHKTYALVAIASSPLIIITAFLFFKKEGKVWAEHEDEADKLTSLVNENLNGIRVVKAFANEQFEIGRFDKQNLIKRKVGMKQAKLHTIFWPISDLLIHTQIAVSIFFGGYLTLSNAITVGEFTSFFAYGIMVTWPMRQIGRIVSQMGMAIVAMDRLSKIIDAEEEDYSGKTLTDFKGNITFNNVSFTYPNATAPALKNVSFNINAGEQVAIVGSTGAGKSTIIALIMRFYEPDAGAILFDGIPINKLSKSYVRSKIGAVLQKPFLFSTTIENNIRYAKPNEAKATIKKAATIAGIEEIAHVFPKKYKTLVGEKGVTLSGGQKQRITLARTLLENPEILILDDATSAVDTATEFKIQNALAKQLKSKTVIVIAHRATSIQNAQKIIVIDNGEVIQTGTPADLALTKGFYKTMIDEQTKLVLDVERNKPEIVGLG